MRRHERERPFRHNFIGNHHSGVVYDPVVLPRDFHVSDSASISEKYENIFGNGAARVWGLGLRRN
jgi:hypothetical protein